MRFRSGMAAAWILPFAATVLAAGCASKPAAQTPQRQVKVDANNITEVQRAGYTIKTKDGQKLYCTKDAKTGSHIQNTVTCLTEAEWQQVHEQTQQSLRTLATQPAMPAGH